MSADALFDLNLIRRYDVSGPRYTSYPTAVQFHAGFDEAAFRDAATRSNAGARPLSLYVHIPFCDTLCFYCACNKIPTKNRAHATPYLEHLEREIALKGALFDRNRPVDQLHFGGGTPTFLSDDQFAALMGVIGQHFQLRGNDEGEYSIEVDPRELRPGTLALLRRLGFNRLSMGVQDFDPQVQQAVNRIQPEAVTWGALDEARRQGFRSVSLDLIYGLPFQTVESFGRTLSRVLEHQPDRLSVFNYAHLPDLFPPQRRIRAEDLPPPEAKLEILHRTIDQLTAAGYVYIGMDHFARPDDELAIAQREGTLHRNFQGYSTHAECDLIGFGVTSISSVSGSFCQNEKEVEPYYAALDAGRLPILRGLALDADDELRAAVITDLICHFRLRTRELERRFGIVFRDYFAGERPALERLAADGLIAITGDDIDVLPPGRLLIRNICMVFDRYLKTGDARRFSKAI